MSVGLAAPQIGHPLRVVIVNLNKSEDDDLILINPVVTSNTGSFDEKYESCMSIPHFRGKVKRRKKLTVSYRDVNFIEQELTATGFLARVILHEVDHLDGILYTDRMEPEQSLEKTDLFLEHGIS